MDVPELPIVLTESQAEAIVRKHLPEHRQSTVKQLTELPNRGYSYASKTRTYVVDLAPAPNPNSTSAPATPSSCFITLAHPPPAGAQHSKPLPLANSLQTTHHIISLIHSQTDIPIPLPTLDVSLSLPLPSSDSDLGKGPTSFHFPYHFLVSPASPISSASILSVAEARRRGVLKPNSKETTLIELQIGRFLGRLHAHVQNDYFGRVRSPAQPAHPQEEESYSWQETFTGVLEALLWEAESTGLELGLGLEVGYEEVRAYLSRAIASFLFDDVEVPSLVWLTGSEEDIYIALPSTSTSSSSPTTPPGPPTSGGLAAILPNLTHALWGDPLLETFFLPPSSPAPALKEAYLKSGGQELILFPRQKTKRMWYDLLLGLIVLRERGGFARGGEGGVGLDGVVQGKGKEVKTEGVGKEGEGTEGEEDRKRLVEWALALVKRTVEALKTAPTY